jgi:hypothetical protein
MPSRLPNPESETFFSTGPKYSNVAYKAELSSRAMTDKMAAVVSFCEMMDHRHHPLWVAKGRKDTPENMCFHFSTSLGIHDCNDLLVRFISFARDFVIKRLRICLRIRNITCFTSPTILNYISVLIVHWMLLDFNRANE